MEICARQCVPGEVLPESSKQQRTHTSTHSTAHAHTPQQTHLVGVHEAPVGLLLDEAGTVVREVAVERPTPAVFLQPLVAQLQMTAK